MNETTCMYTLKPVVNLSEKIDFPKCMYSMKNIQTSSCNAEPLGRPAAEDRIIANVLEQKPLPGMKELEIRQEAILKQLTQLKEQVLKLKANLKQPSPQPSKQAHTTANLNEKVKDALTRQDIVINASPKHPPYAILALCRLWRDYLAFKVSCHTHSNVAEFPSELSDFVQSNGNITTNGHLPLVTILIVWKDVGVDTELVVSPMSRASVRGEVNILRYLSRLGPARYNYESANDHVRATVVDAILDTCHCLAWSRTVKERQALVRSLNVALGKSQYLTGDDVTVADIAAWSVLSRISEPNIVQDLTVNMTKWFQRCSGIFKTNSL